MRPGAALRNAATTARGGAPRRYSLAATTEALAGSPGSLGAGAPPREAPVRAAPSKEAFQIEASTCA